MSKNPHTELLAFPNFSYTYRQMYLTVRLLCYHEANSSLAFNNKQNRYFNFQVCLGMEDLTHIYRDV